MSWAKFDDNYDSNPKILLAGLHGKSLHATSIRWSRRLETEGKILKVALVQVGILAQLPAARIKPSSTLLVELNLWEEGDDHWMIHDFDQYGPPQYRSQQPWYGQRQRQLYRDDELRAAIKARDGNQCHYCGTEVDWLDRRGARGAQFEHVDPDGPNTLENVVVSCRSCNGRKGQGSDKRNSSANKFASIPKHPPLPDPVPVPSPVVSLEQLRDRAIGRGVAPDTVTHRLAGLQQLAEEKGAKFWIAYVTKGYQGQACLFDQHVSRWLEEDHGARKEAERETPPWLNLHKPMNESA